MRPSPAALILGTILQATVASSHAVTLSINTPAEATLGSPTQADVVISDLGDMTAPSLGAFDIDVSFNPSLLGFDAVSFGTELDRTVGSSIRDANDSVPSGVVNLFELSLDAPATLDAEQPASFTLGTLSFSTDSVGAGTFAIPDFTLADSLGAPIEAITQSATVVVTGATIQVIEGDGQTAAPNQTLAPMVINVSTPDGQPLGDVSVTWTVSPAGAATLDSPTTTTVNGRASNTVTAVQPGTVTVRASAGGAGAATFTAVVGDIPVPPNPTETQIEVANTVGNACDEIEAIPAEDRTPGQADLLETCSGLSMSSDTGSALDDLAPEEVTAQGTTAVEAAGTQVSNIETRLIGLRGGNQEAVSLAGLILNLRGQSVPGEILDAMVPRGGGAGDDDSSMLGKFGIFMNGEVSFGDKDGTVNETGFDFDSEGITFGLDYRLTDNAIIGVAGGIASSDADFDGSSGSLDATSRTLSVYGTYYHSSRIYVDGIVSLSKNNFDTSRRINTAGQTAEGSTDGTEYALSIGAGYELSRGAFSFGPYGRFNYTHVDIDDYTEEAGIPGAAGAGSVLAIDDQKIKSLSTVLGAEVSYPISSTYGVFVPQLRVEWEHEFKDDRRDIKASFVNDPTNSTFQNVTDSPDRDFFNIGAGVSASFAAGKSAFLYYETQLGRSQITQHSVKAGLRFEF